MPLATAKSYMDIVRQPPWCYTAAFLVASALLWSTQRQRKAASEGPAPQGREKQLIASDPKILFEHSTFKRYETAYGIYPSIRTIVIGRNRAGPDPKSEPLPVLVFVHGLGGSMAQFEPLMKRLSVSAPCFGIDFAGCGLSRFAPSSWNAYTQEALTELVRVAFLDHFPDASRRVIMIGHSMGCRIAQALAKLSSETISTTAGARRWPSTLGVAAICPEDKTFTHSQEVIIGAMLTVPTPLFDLWRAFDRRGGIESHSVTRFVGQAANRHTRRLQLEFNEQSQTPVFRRMAWGAVKGFIDGASGWAKLDPKIKILLIAGREDPITPSSALERIQNAVRTTNPQANITTRIIPGSHALPFDSNSSHSVAALVQNFLEDIDEHLSMRWQLLHSNTGDKWDVKNLQKWLSVLPVSGPIGKPRPLFRAMKTLRGIDEIHNPDNFVRQWEHEIKAVIDISQDQPKYDPALFQPRSVEYHKFSTPSKVVPTVDQVAHFIALVDELREKEVPGWQGDAKVGRDRTIGVHCHYGFNRTGFLICAYLIERCGYSIEDALAEFADAKPPGIKHEYFIDQLYLRYSSSEGQRSGGL